MGDKLMRACLFAKNFFGWLEYWCSSEMWRRQEAKEEGVKLPPRMRSPRCWWGCIRSAWIASGNRDEFGQFVWVSPRQLDELNKDFYARATEWSE